MTRRRVTTKPTCGTCGKILRTSAATCAQCLLKRPYHSGRNRQGRLAKERDEDMTNSDDFMPSVEQLAAYSVQAANFAEYQHPAYCAVGLLAELSELKDALQHDRDKVIYELGDCWWMIVNLTRELGLDDLRLVYPSSTVYGIQIDVEALAIEYLPTVARWLRGDHRGATIRMLANDAVSILLAIGRLNELSAQDIFRANIAKLADRKARGVIKGQGDNR